MDYRYTKEKKKNLTTFDIYAVVLVVGMFFFVLKLLT